MAAGTPTPQAETKVLAAAATGLVGFLEDRRVCPDRVFGDAGLDPRLLDKPTSAIGLDQYCAILEDAARKASDPNIGLDYGQQFTPDMLGLIGYIALSSRTMLDAADNLARHFRDHQQSTATTLSFAAPFHHLTYRVDPARVLRRDQDAVVTLGMFVNVFRHAAGARWAPDMVHLEQARGENWREIERAFDAPVVFGQQTNALLFRPERARLPMPNADPRLLELLRANLTGLGLGDAAPSLIERVRTTVRDNLGVAPLDLQFVSDAVSVPRWTVQRRLAEANTSFAELVDQERRKLAERHVLNRDLQISQLSERLGYAEISAFTRAFKRWNEVSPAKYRKQRLGAHVTCDDVID